MIEASIPQRLTGNELLSSAEPSIQLLEFWQWAFSDVLSNSLRGVYAEFLVTKALGVATGIRQEWSPFDLITANNKRVEVKSCAYLQTWFQPDQSKIIFGISPSRAYDYLTGLFAEEVKRQADLYVLCLLDHQEKATVDPLNIEQWKFYVLPTKILNEKMPKQKSIGLSKLLKLHPKEVRFEELREAIEQCIVE